MTTYLELPLDVNYTYSPPSRGLRGEYGEPLEPDEDESIEINDVLLKGTSIIHLLSVAEMNQLEKDIWQGIEDSTY